MAAHNRSKQRHCPRKRFNVFESYDSESEFSVELKSVNSELEP